MLILWIIAGVLFGWILMELLGGLCRLRVPYTFNIAFAFIGGLGVYSFLSGVCI